MYAWIERHTFCRNLADSELAESVFELFANQIDAITKFLKVPGRNLQCQIKAVERRQERLQRFCYGVVLELLLLAGGTLARILKFRLQAGQTVKHHLALFIGFRRFST